MPRKLNAFEQRLQDTLGAVPDTILTAACGDVDAGKVVEWCPECKLVREAGRPHAYVRPVFGATRCRLCGVNADSFGCYETCKVGGPAHEWVTRRTCTRAPNPHAKCCPECPNDA